MTAASSSSIATPTPRHLRHLRRARLAPTSYHWRDAGFASLARMLRLAVVITLLGACGGAAPPASTAPADGKASAADAAFARFVDEFFEADARYSPSNAVGNGFHAYDAQIEDRSRARIEQRIAELHGFLDRLGRLDRGALGFDNAIDAQAIEAQIRSDLLSLETLRVWTRNPMVYAGLPGGAIDALMKRDFAPKQDRLRSLI